MVEALEYLGNPLAQSAKEKLQAATQNPNKEAAIAEIQKVLDPLCLIGIQINPESRVKVSPGPASPELVRQGWRQFLIKVQNEAGVTTELRCESPNAKPLANSPKGEVDDRWLELQLFNSQPLTKNLSGLGLEYRIIQLYSRDAGKREAQLNVRCGAGELRISVFARTV